MTYGYDHIRDTTLSYTERWGLPVHLQFHVGTDPHHTRMIANPYPDDDPEAHPFRVANMVRDLILTEATILWPPTPPLPLLEQHLPGSIGNSSHTIHAAHPDLVGTVHIATSFGTFDEVPHAFTTARIEWNLDPHITVHTR